MLMGNYDNENGRCVFPLTTLQIGDLQSYRSHLSLFLATESNKFYILVDNRPWLEGLGSRPAHLWQLMVTKSRLSPFANTSARKARKTAKQKEGCKANNNGPTNSSKCTKSTKSKISKRWFSLIDAVTLSRKRALLPVKNLKYSLQLNHDLQRTLFGLIIFEVSWTDVRGINYVNELQTDTSLAVETKFMRRWEFDSIMHALGCLCSWLSGTYREQNLLREYLLSTVEEIYYDAEEELSDEETPYFYDVAVESALHCCVARSHNVDTVATENNIDILHTPPPPDVPYKRRKVTRSNSSGIEVGVYSEETPKTPKGIAHPFFVSTLEATEYRDVLLLFRFDDRDLPFKLRDIITTDLRLLTLLESGLPSWVIFLQSYPVFCHIYRPWMCPLARVLYLIVSIATVVIGFYDLYKNVPLLKATASRLFGPLFDWIETWEMVSRIKYLGTMLFLHNLEKAVKWFVMITRSVRSFFSVLAQPILVPLVEFFRCLLPFWNLCIQLAESFYSFIWIIIGSSCNLVGSVAEIILSPIWCVVSLVRTIALSIVLPLFWVLWEIMYSPVRLALALVSFILFVFNLIYEMLGELWSALCTVFWITSATEATVKTSTYEVSMWRSLWNDLFSKVFRAVRSILNGFVDFFATCNRHRLSINNRIKELVGKLSHQPCPPQHMYPHHKKRIVDPYQWAQACRSPRMAETAGRQPQRVKKE